MAIGLLDASVDRAEAMATHALANLTGATDLAAVEQQLAAIDAFAASSPVDVKLRLVRKYERNAAVGRLVKARDGDACRLCGEPGFLKRSGEPYLEIHHVRHLAQGGTNLSDNLVSLCATCHRRAHYADLSSGPAATALGL